MGTTDVVVSDLVDGNGVVLSCFPAIMYCTSTAAHVNTTTQLTRTTVIQYFHLNAGSGSLHSCVDSFVQVALHPSPS